MLRGSEPAGRMNIGSEKFGALQEILPINFYEAKIWISVTFLRKWGDIKVNLTEWYWSKQCQDFSEKTTMLEEERCGKRSHIWWRVRVIIFFLTVQFNFLKRFGCTNFIIHSPKWGMGRKKSHADRWWWRWRWWWSWWLDPIGSTVRYEVMKLCTGSV